MLTEESFKNFKTRRLKNICKAICVFDSRYDFFDDTESTGYMMLPEKLSYEYTFPSEYVIFQSSLNTKRRRYVELLLMVYEFTHNTKRWDYTRYSKLPFFDSIEELCVKIDLIG